MIRKIGERKYERGQNLLELVFILGALIAIVIGVLDLGRVFQVVISLTNSAREGARYLTIRPDDKGFDHTGTAYTHPAYYYSRTKEAVVKESANFGIELTTDDVTVTCEDVGNDGVCDRYSKVYVSATLGFDFISGIFPDAITITRMAEMRIP